LNYNDSVATVQSALNALSTVSAVGGVTVGGTPPSDSGSQMSVTFLAAAGDVSQVTISSSMSPGTHAMSTQTQGRDGWINRSTNTVDDVISGVTLRLHDTTDDGAGGYNSIEVNLTRDTEALKTKLNTLIEAYNATVMFIQEKTKYDAKTKTSGILANDYSVSTIWSQIKDPFSGLLAGFNADDNDFTSPDDIGLSLDADGLLELDSTIFDEAVVDNYLGVLSLIGAMKTGSSDSYDIKFYGAGANTTAGQYEVKVTGDGSSITSAQIRLAGDTTWRDASFSGSLVSGNSTLDSNGNPVYPEHSLQISVDVSKTVPGGTTTNVYVKQGFAGATEDMLDALLNTTKGRVPISINGLDTQIDNANDRIAQEEDRLEKVEQRLTERFARLERTLSIIQQQMGALGMVQ
jgi:flagellar hook-associated protein 2